MNFTDKGQVQIGDFDAGLLSTDDALMELHRDDTSDLPERGLHSLGKVASAISNAISWMVSGIGIDRNCDDFRFAHGVARTIDP